MIDLKLTERQSLVVAQALAAYDAQLALVGHSHTHKQRRLLTTVAQELARSFQRASDPLEALIPPGNILN